MSKVDVFVEAPEVRICNIKGIAYLHAGDLLDAWHLFVTARKDPRFGIKNVIERAQIQIDEEEDEEDRKEME